MASQGARRATRAAAERPAQAHSMASAQFVYVNEIGKESEPMGVNQLAALIVLGTTSDATTLM